VIEADEGAAPVRRGDSWVPSAFWATFPESDYCVRIRVVIRRGRPWVDEVVVERVGDPRTAPPLTTLTMRKVYIDKLLRSALDQAEKPLELATEDGFPPRAFRVPGTSKGQGWIGPTVTSRSRRAGYPDEFLREVADIYREATETKLVVRDELHHRLGGSGGSAGRWIRAAKDRGFIKED
jgi:hypothetical protein